MKFKKAISILCLGILGLNMCTNFCTNKPQAFKYDKKTEKFTIDHKIAVIFACDAEEENDNRISDLLKCMDWLQEYWNDHKESNCKNTIECYFMSTEDLKDLQTKEKLTEHCNTENISIISLTDTDGYIPDTLSSTIETLGYGKNNMPLVLPPCHKTDMVKKSIQEKTNTVFLVNALETGLKRVHEMWLTYDPTKTTETKVPLGAIKLADRYTDGQKI